MITGLYAGLCAFMMMVLVLRVVARRIKHRVSLGDGGNDDLNRHMRAHGNFAETVPLALLLMLLLEMRGIPFWILHWLGALLVMGRISHIIGLTTGKGYGPYRMAGMILTMSVYIIGGALAVYQYIDWAFLR
jgi:uncharacterized membrane protein YecN with MAPEG domain